MNIIKQLLFVFIVAVASSLTAASYNVVDFGAVGSDTRSDHAAIQNALNMALGASAKTEVRIPKGTYYIDRALHIYSNTHLTLDSGAVIRRLHSATDQLMLLGRHVVTGTDKPCDRDSTCKHGGHTQTQNIVVSGGTWDACAYASENIGIFYFGHGRNIVLKDTILKGATNHPMNLSGSADITVSNVTFTDSVKFTGSDAAFWEEFAKGNEERYNSIEAIHLDVTTAEGEFGNYPHDSTICENVTIANCLFSNVFCGVGNHHVVKGKPSKNIKIDGCSFANVKYYAALAYGFDGFSMTNNKVADSSGLIKASSAKVEVKDNVASNSKEDTIFFYKEVSGSIERNTIDTSNAHGIMLYQSQATINGDKICNHVKCGVWAEESSVSIVGNEVADVGMFGLYLGKCTDGPIISSNLVSKVADDGIYVDRTSGAVVFSNKVEDFSRMGIRIQGTDESHCDNAEVYENELKGLSANYADVRIDAFSEGTTVRDNICMNLGVMISNDMNGKVEYHPADARNVVVNRTSKNSAVITWDRLSGITSYILETLDATGRILSSGTLATDETSATVNNLNDSMPYYFRVRTSHRLWGVDYYSLGNGKPVQSTWDAQKYTIRFHKNDGSEEALERAFEYGVKTRMPYLKSGLGWGRAGMIMKGWATSKAAADAGTVWNLDGAYVIKPVGVGQVLNLYAIWVIDPAYYVVHYEGNGASSGVMLDQTGMKYGTAQALKANAFARTGFVFKGWSRSAAATAAAYVDGAKISKPSPNPTGSVLTLYAVWTEDPACYRVAFNGNGATSGTMATQYGFTPGKPGVTLAKNTYQRRGYDFLGWAKFPASTAPLFPDEANLNTSTSRGTTLTLYAVWKVDTKKCFTVAFDGNGAITGKMQNQEGFVAGYGTALTANAFARPGYVFLGWSRNPTATTAQYADKAKVYTPNPVVNPGETMILYAVWAVIPTETYTVRFDGNGAASGAMADQRGFVPSKALQPLTANRFLRPGYEFKGWAKFPKSTTALFSDMQKLATSTSVGTTLTLYAVWSANAAWQAPIYTVRLDRNDGSGYVYEEPYTIGESRRINALANLVWERKGFDFVGWSRSSSAVTASIVDQALITNEASAGETVTFYGVWRLKPTYYAIRFFKNDGSGAWRTDGRFVFGEKTRMPSLKNGLQWSRPGYNFLGWATSKANADAKIIWKGDWAYVATGVPAGTIKDAYAVWEPSNAEEYSICYSAPQPKGTDSAGNAGYYCGVLEDGSGIYDLFVEEPWREESSGYLRIQTADEVRSNDCTVRRVDDGWATVVPSGAIILR